MAEGMISLAAHSFGSARDITRRPAAAVAEASRRLVRSRKFAKWTLQRSVPG